jgi:hypothetical protein
MASGDKVVSRDLNRPYAHMNNSAVQSVANGTTRAQATFDTTLLDSLAPGVTQCDLAGDRLVIGEDGVYVVVAQGTFALNTTGQRTVALFSGAAGANFAASTVQAAPTFPTRVQVVSPPTRLVAGDDVRLGLYQTSGGALNTDTTQGGVFLSMYKIAD